MARVRSLADSLRASDYANFLQAAFYPNQARQPYLALRLFNVELARLRETVSQDRLGQLRAAWWRDAVSSVYTETPYNHPIILALAQTKSYTNLSKHHFLRIIDAREQNLLSPSFTSLDQISTYSKKTHFSLLSLQLQLLNLQIPSSSFSSNEEKRSNNGEDNIPSLSTLDHALHHLALAETITVLLKALPHYAQRRIAVIPNEISADVSLVLEDLYRKGPAAHGITDAVYALHHMATTELDKTRSTLSLKEGNAKLHPSLVPLFLSATPIRSYLDRLSSAQYNAFDESLHKRYWKYPFQIWNDNRRRCF